MPHSEAIFNKRRDEEKSSDKYQNVSRVLENISGDLV